MATWVKRGLPESLNTDSVPLAGNSFKNGWLWSRLYPFYWTLIYLFSSPSPSLSSLVACILRANDCEMGSLRNSKMHSHGLNLLPKMLAEMLNQSIWSLV